MSQKPDIEVPQTLHPILRYRPQPIPPSSLKFLMKTFSPSNNNSGFAISKLKFSVPVVSWGRWVGGSLEYLFHRITVGFKIHVLSTPDWRQIMKKFKNSKECFSIPTSGVSVGWNVCGGWSVECFQLLRVHRGCSSTSATARRTPSSSPGAGWRSKMRKTSRGNNQIKRLLVATYGDIKYRQKCRAKTKL